MKNVVETAREPSGYWLLRLECGHFKGSGNVNAPKKARCGACESDYARVRFEHFKLGNTKP